RGGPGDREKARELLSEAIDTARSIGMKRLLTEALESKLHLEGVVVDDTTSTRSSIEAVVSSLDRRPPAPAPHAAPDGPVTLMLSAMEGFGALVERVGDRRAHEILGQHNQIVRERVKLSGGFEVERQEDGFLVAFSSAERAVRCAIDIQEAIASY